MPRACEPHGHSCSCKERMGNDFYFLPHDRCLFVRQCAQEETMAELIERWAIVPFQRDPIRGGRLT